MSAPCIEAFSDVPKFMVDGGSDTDFARDGEAASLQPQINAAVRDLFFSDGEQTQLFRGVFDSSLDSLVLVAAHAFFGGAQDRFRWFRWCYGNDRFLWLNFNRSRRRGRLSRNSWRCPGFDRVRRCRLY